MTTFYDNNPLSLVPTIYRHIHLLDPMAHMCHINIMGSDCRCHQFSPIWVNAGGVMYVSSFLFWHEKTAWIYVIIGSHFKIWVSEIFWISIHKFAIGIQNTNTRNILNQCFMVVVKHQETIFNILIWTLTHWDLVTPDIWVNIGSGNGSLPEGTKPLSEPMLTYHQ